MKKIITISLATVVICSCFIGCAKCIKTETYADQVEIVGTYCEDGRWTPIFNGNLRSLRN